MFGLGTNQNLVRQLGLLTDILMLTSCLTGQVESRWIELSPEIRYMHLSATRGKVVEVTLVLVCIDWQGALCSVSFVH